jgi:hypothetical protein
MRVSRWSQECFDGEERARPMLFARLRYQTVGAKKSISNEKEGKWSRIRSCN